MNMKQKVLLASMFVFGFQALSAQNDGRVGIGTEDPKAILMSFIIANYQQHKLKVLFFQN